jgi:hypothetical protein
VKDPFPFDDDGGGKEPSCLENAIAIILGMVFVCMVLTKIFLGF